jgi:hypothetical protein
MKTLTPMTNWKNCVREMKTRLCSEQVPVTAKELLAKGWELTEQSMALVGMDIPVYLDYQIDGRGYCQVTRVATLDKLAQAIAALDEDIGRLAQGKPALSITTPTSNSCARTNDETIELGQLTGPIY